MNRSVLQAELPDATRIPVKKSLDRMLAVR